MVRRTGEKHQNSTVPDAVVVQMRDLHENPHKPMGAYRIARLLGYPVNTVKKIVYYQSRIANLAPVNKDE